MFKFTFKFTSTFLLSVLTWVSFMLGSGNLVCYLLLTQTKILNSVLELPLGHALGWGEGFQGARAFVYFEHMPSSN